ncbi:MFS transporter small subunit [Amycolatopsis sp. CA-161197]
MSAPNVEGRPAGRTALLVVAWLWVLVPFVYGVYELILKVIDLFSS